MNIGARHFHRLGLGIASLALAGCAASPSSSGQSQPTPQEIEQHVIAIDGAGRPHDPNSPQSQAWDMPRYRQQIARMFAALGNARHAQPNCKVLVFVHGGLNSPQDSLTSAKQEMHGIIAAGYFPIFLDWNSDILDCYGEHLTSLTQGETDTTIGRRLLTPVYLISDMVRAVARTPIVWISQAASDIEGSIADVAAIPHRQDLKTERTPANAKSALWAQSDRGQAVAQVYQRLRNLELAEKNLPDNQRTQIRVYIGPDLDVSPWHMAALGAAYLVTSPIKYGSEPIIDWLGVPAWQNMSRRTLMAFDGDLGGNPSNPNLNADVVGKREVRTAHAQDFSTTGALEVFREELHKVAAPARASRSNTQPAPTNLQITLVGHSMGTMILDEWLRRDLLEEKGTEYKQIVYMAAACSVRDFGRAVVPYLLQHHTTQFYNLMLHPLAELRERRRACDLPPRGSLLVWLDNFLTDPQTPLDRTMGRWDNIIPVTEIIPPSVRGRITLKAFALAPYDGSVPPGQPDYGPQEHGQFRGQPYWCPEFWADENPVVPSQSCVVPHPAASQPASTTQPSASR